MGVIKILHCEITDNIGGIETFLINLLRAVDRTQFQLDFITKSASPAFENEIISLGSDIHYLPSITRHPMRFKKELFKILRKHNYSIVHVHKNSCADISVFKICKKADIRRVVAHSHNTAGTGGKWTAPLHYLNRYKLATLSHLYFACSELAGRWLFGDNLYDSGNVKLIRNAIDLSRFRFDSQIREAIREELNIKDRFVVSHVGRFAKQKNHSFLIDIFEQVYAKNPDSVLLLIGEGELEQEIRDKVERFKLTDNVRFLGVRDDVHRLLMGTDVFLLPSLYEGLPFVVVEAQSCGLPTVISNTISREAKVADNVMFVSLNQSAQEWAKKVLGSRVEDRGAGFERVVEEGYEIGAVAEELCGCYLKFLGI